MIFKVQEQHFVTHTPETQYFISDGRGNYLTKDGTISKTVKNGWWHTKKEAEIFFAGWLSLSLPLESSCSLCSQQSAKTTTLQQIDTNKFDKKQQFPLGMRYKDIYGITWTYYHKVKPKPDPYHQPNLSAIDYEPQYEIGTRLVTGLGERYRYGALNFGMTYTDKITGKIYNCIQYRWFCVKH